MNINEYLALTGTTKTKAAAELGCSLSLVSRWCAGLTSPSRHWWARIQAWSRGAITTDVPRRASGG